MYLLFFKISPAELFLQLLNKNYRLFRRGENTKLLIREKTGKKFSGKCCFENKKTFSFTGDFPDRPVTAAFSEGGKYDTARRQNIFFPLR